MKMNVHNSSSKGSEHSFNNSNLKSNARLNEAELTESSNSISSYSAYCSELSNLDGAVLSTSAGQNAHDVSRIVVDAVHPLFIGYRNVTRDVATSTDDQKYYCRQCKLSIELNKESVIEHFENTSHESVMVCIYCNTNVYEYFYNDKSIIYHKCKPSNTSNLNDTSNLDMTDRTASIADT